VNEPLEKIEKVVSIVATFVWMVFVVINLLHVTGAVQLPAGVALNVNYQVEPVAKQIIDATYRIFVYVLIFVTIVAGIQAALGFVRRFIAAFIPVSIPSGSLDGLIRTVIGLYLIKLIVDGMLRYWGYAVHSVLLVMAVDMGTLTYMVTAIVGVALGALLVLYITRGEEVIRL